MDEIIKTEQKKKVEKTGKVTIPLIPGEEKTVKVIINGKEFVVPKGTEVEVPVPVKKVLENHLRCKYESYEHSAALEFKD